MLNDAQHPWTLLGSARGLRVARRASSVASGGRFAERTATVAKTTKWDRLPHEKKVQILERLDRAVEELKSIRKDVTAAKLGKRTAA